MEFTIPCAKFEGSLTTHCARSGWPASKDRCQQAEAYSPSHRTGA
ncbi:MAG: hypothetical protein ACLVJK_08730 [Alistipes putredinis]